MSKDNSQFENVLFTQVVAGNGAFYNITHRGDGDLADFVLKCDIEICSLVKQGFKIPRSAEDSNDNKAYPAYVITSKIEDGKTTHKIKSPPGTAYHKFGISIWPEVLELFGEKLYKEIQEASSQGKTFQLPAGWQFVIKESQFEDSDDDGKIKTRRKARALINPDGEMLEAEYCENGMQPTTLQSENKNGNNLTPLEIKRNAFYALLLQAYADGKGLLDKTNASVFKQQAKQALSISTINKIEAEFKSFIKEAEKAASKKTPSSLFSETREKLKKEVDDMLNAGLISDDDARYQYDLIENAVSKDDLAAIASNLKSSAPANDDGLPF